MIEYDMTLQNKVSGKQALINKIRLICEMKTTDIPYYSKGMDLNLFTYGSPSDAIRLALIDYNPSVKISSTNARITIANVDIDITDLI